MRPLGSAAWRVLWQGAGGATGLGSLDGTCHPRTSLERDPDCGEVRGELREWQSTGGEWGVFVTPSREASRTGLRREFPGRCSSRDVAPAGGGRRFHAATSGPHGNGRRSHSAGIRQRSALARAAPARTTFRLAMHGYISGPGCAGYLPRRCSSRDVAPEGIVQRMHATKERLLTGVRGGHKLD